MLSVILYSTPAPLEAVQAVGAVGMSATQNGQMGTVSTSKCFNCHIIIKQSKKMCDNVLIYLCA
jgi:hypothetical protein